MTDKTPSPGNAPGFPAPKSLALCQNDAVQLHGLIYALDHLLTEGTTENRDLSSAAHSLCMIARDLSGQLANDLDRVPG